MSMSRVEDLWTRYLSDGTLPADEEQDLLRALEGDEALRRKLISDKQFDGLLDALNAPDEDGRQFIRSFQDRLAVEGDDGKFIAQVEEKIRRKPARRPAPPASSSPLPLFSRGRNPRGNPGPGVRDQRRASCPRRQISGDAPDGGAAADRAARGAREGRSLPAPQPEAPKPAVEIPKAPEPRQPEPAPPAPRPEQTPAPVTVPERKTVAEPPKPVERAVAKLERIEGECRPARAGDIAPGRGVETLDPKSAAVVVFPTARAWNSVPRPPLRLRRCQGENAPSGERLDRGGGGQAAAGSADDHPDSPCRSPRAGDDPPGHDRALGAGSTRLDVVSGKVRSPVSPTARPSTS
jgi:hypothetical protein